MHIIIKQRPQQNRSIGEHAIVEGQIPLRVEGLAGETTPKAKVKLGDRR